ncbi:MAG: DUF116 domain-containing protein [Bacillota bacterium]
MTTHKRLFLGLFLLFTFLLIISLALLAYFLIRPEAVVFHYILLGFLVILAVVALASLLALAVATISLLRGTPPPGLNRLVKKVMVFLFPVIVQLGKALHIAQERVQGSFIVVNNKLIETEHKKVAPNKLLLLLPHCLQDQDCPHKITLDPYNCRRCGKCPIDSLLSLSEKWQVKVQVVTGGTLARQAVKKLRPDCVLAVACERDLSSGIIDSYPMPVWGVLNERPMGPCRNTRVSLHDLEEKLQEILIKQ